MKKRIVAFLLTLAMLVGLVPQMMLAALADELAAAYTLENDFIRVSVSKKNGGFTVATRLTGDELFRDHTHFTPEVIKLHAAFIAGALSEL